VTDAEIANEVPPEDFPYLAGGRDQEWWAQQASFGLAQVMGAVARERGFRGLYLPELCDPETGMLYGIKHLDKFLQKYDLRTALLRYNGGGNPAYPDEVMKKLSAIRS
jgi:soluble lytic murein transglycosylase-like protein